MPAVKVVDRKLRVFGIEQGRRGKGELLAVSRDRGLDKAVFTGQRDARAVDVKLVVDRSGGNRAGDLRSVGQCQRRAEVARVVRSGRADEGGHQSAERIAAQRIRLSPAREAIITDRRRGRVNRLGGCSQGAALIVGRDGQRMVLRIGIDVRAPVSQTCPKGLT